MNPATKLLNAIDRAFSGPVNVARVMPPSQNSRPAGDESGIVRNSSSPATPERMKAELAPKVVKRPEPHQLANVPHPNMEQCRVFDAALLDGVSVHYNPPEAAMSQLRELDAPYDRLQAAITECMKSPHAKHLAHIADLARRTAEGDTTVNAADAWTAEDWAEDQRVRVSAFKSEARKIREKAWTIAEPALHAKAESLNELADFLEEKERERYEHWATPYRPPNYVLLLRKYAASLTDGSRAGIGRPSGMLQGI